MTREVRPTLNPALREFWRTPARNRVLYGGRSSSKTWDAAGFAIFLAVNFQVRFLCTRQFQNRIEESVYTVLKIQIARFGLLDEFVILQNKIVCRATGSEFIFYGLWRSLGNIRGLEGIDICWLEEGHYLTEEQWVELEPTLRKEGSQFWLIFNPHFSTDFAWQRFIVNPPPDTIKRKINYTENPFLSRTMLRVIEAAKAEDEEEFNHIYLGEPKLNDENAVIKRTHLIAALDADKTLSIDVSGSIRIGFDVADDGEDLCAMVHAHGNKAMWSDLWKAREDELLKSCARVWSEARARNASVTYDAIGVGAMAGSKFNELNTGHAHPVMHSKFFAGGAPLKPDVTYASTGIKNRDFFSNIKSQAWWSVADRLRNTYNAVHGGQSFDAENMIFIDSTMPNLDKLIDELTTPKRDYDMNGRVKVESKKDLAKREISSPNLADAFIMAFQNVSQNSWDEYR